MFHSQVFNEINARKLNNELNVLSGLASNRIFLSVIVVTIFVQFLMVHFGGNAIKVRARVRMHKRTYVRTNVHT